MENQTNHILPSVLRELPAYVRAEIGNLSQQKQQIFMDEYRDKAKQLNTAYIAWVLFGCHYAYFGKWGMQILFWITFGGIGFWLIYDGFRMKSLLKEINDHVAMEAFADVKGMNV